ncbi:Alanine dehydrogenase [Candidatus Bealeia paramacronuclearis]|uniref:Alanine dehydrogenase n=1 Tax=Candidatus Bealeia paramacronuclearis TaxID=1921001 RepID=A0ABZ2CAJ5_9PROT|nr:Alanine dehydrogenase [Candidatus Bealeia paramacronuclearis]
MIIGVPKEIKIHEYRVGLLPSAVRELIHAGHSVLVETQTGAGIGCSDDDYKAAGASILSSAAEVFDRAQMIVKVKEPQETEWRMLKSGQVLLTFLHLAADPDQAQGLLKSNCIAIAYDTVTDERGGLPLLAPMSEVAGRMSIQVGAHCLEKGKGGAGILLGGVPGVLPGKVVVIGGGSVGINAARVALGLGAEVTIIDKSARRLIELDALFGPQLKTLYANLEAIESAVIDADLVIGAVLVPGAAAPKLVTEAMVKKMRHGSVLVDVAIDQGGCFETSRPTTHTHPTYVEYGVVHYCVTNMPGGVARTSAFALNNVTLPFVMALANKGYKKALLDDVHLRGGLNVYQGHITHPVVAQELGLSYTSPESLI